jgi:murein DD-endopeptidase MepM/ murein hydrolase activator NlpD
MGLSESAANMGKAIGGAAAFLLEKQEERDILDVERALNEFQKWNLDYTNAPETGIFNDKRYQYGGADGLTGKYENDSKKEAERLMKTLRTPRARDAFSRKAPASATPFYKGVMEWEARQAEADIDLQTQARIDAAAQTMIQFPHDPEAARGFADAVTDAVMFQMRNAPEEAVKIRIESEISKGETARISVIAADDPIAAQAEITGSKYLLPADRAALKAENRAAADLVKAQAAADELTARFGTDAAGQTAALARIDARYKPGPERDRVKSAYRAAAAEITRLENLRDAEEADRQRKNFEAAALNFFANGRVPGAAELEKGLTGGDYSLSQYEALTRWQEISETRAGITKRLSRTIPGWNGMTLQQREEAVMRDYGRTAAEREEVLDYIEAGIADGSVTDAELTAAHNNMYITAGEAERYKKAGAKFREYEKGVTGIYKKRLETAISLIADNRKFDGPIKDSGLGRIARGVFFEGLEYLDARDPKFEERVREAAARAIGAMLDELPDEPLTKGWIIKEDTPFGDAVKRAAEYVTSASGMEGPEFRRDDIPLAAGTITTGDISKDLLGGDFEMTSGYDRPRDGGRRIHGGYDFAAPKGTAVSAPAMFGPDTEFKVTRVARGQNGAKTGAGNSVTLEWRDGETGDMYQIQMGHLDAVSAGLKAGVTVTPGAPLGTVGNTGSVIADKGDGSHLDFKFKVNGKNRDILKWHTEEYRRRREAEESELDAIMKGYEQP